jgi:dienelactone hydrolase
MLNRMLRPATTALLLAALAVAGCVPFVAGPVPPPADAERVRFDNATPGAPLIVPAALLRPAGGARRPAVVLLHGCHGVSASTYDWARWFRDLGYVALVVDSWTPRGLTEGCTERSPDVHYTERFSDAIGALRFLQARGDVDAAHVGAIGWSNGGAFAMAVVNGPSLERARARGVALPGRGYAAAVGVYPGGCPSIVSERVVEPLLVLIGGADDWTLASACRAMVDGMRAKGADATIVVYPGAYHYFDVVGQPRAWLGDVANDNLPGGCCGATVAYDAAAAADARARVRAFFARHLRGAAAR